jgi:phytoene synthase
MNEAPSGSTPPNEDPVIKNVRQHDPDRFLTALFAPSDKRDALLTLYAFNHELARAREVASQPLLAMIRLHWWREVVEGTEKRHEIATPLTAALAAGALRPQDLLPLVEAREREVEGFFTTQAAWQDWLLAGAGGLAVAAAHVLGAAVPEDFRPYGAAYGLAGALRWARTHAAAGFCTLPDDALAAEGLTREAVIAEPGVAGLDAVLGRLAGLAFNPKDRKKIPRPQIAAALPAVLARRDLARLGKPAMPRGLGDRLAVLTAYWRGAV